MATMEKKKNRKEQCRSGDGEIRTLVHVFNGEALVENGMAIASSNPTSECVPENTESRDSNGIWTLVFLAALLMIAKR